MLRTVLVSAGLVLMMANTAWAHEVSFSLLRDPAVVDSNLTLNPGKSNERTVLAPWVPALLDVENKAPHPVTIHEMGVTCAAGMESYTKVIPVDREVAAGVAVSINEYIDALPALENRRYECVVVVQWSGPHHRHLATFEIETQ